MGKRQEAALETRNKIIAAVQGLLEEQSADSINIEDITNRAGVAKGSFYTYFKRKEDVILEISLMEFEAAKELIEDASVSVYERIRFYLEKSARIIEKNTRQIAQQWMRSAVAPLNDESSGIRKYRFDMDNLIAMLELSVRTGGLRPDTPVEQIAENIVNTYYGTVAIWCIKNGSQGELNKSIDWYCENTLPAVLKKYEER